ncbi:MAG: short-chain dehydrogenase [Sphingobacteriales bacterium]|nr:short-chain dehydrogenase [Sphingobacteriales bacterium]
MINEVIAKFIEGGHLAKNAVKIEFKKRNTILGIFVQSADYEDLKSKNFWRIVSETHIAEWKQSQDNKLAKIYSGAEFNRITLPKSSVAAV